MADHLRAGVGDVGEYAGGPQEDVIFDFSPCVNRDVVLDLDVVPDYHIVGDLTVLTEDTALSDLHPFHDVGEVPNLRAGPYFTWLVYNRGWVNEIGFIRWYRLHGHRHLPVALQRFLPGVQDPIEIDKRQRKVVV